MSTPQRFKDKEYRNWVKCSLSLIVMKEGLHDYVNTGVENLHLHIKTNLSSTPGGSSVGICGSCTWRDVRKDRGYPNTWYMKCSNRVCDRWLSEILAVHNEPNNPGINWKNADISQWPTKPYEIAKVYMPKDQDRIHNLPQELDAPAILSLLKYCTRFSKHIPNVQLLSELIGVRNEIMHSSEFKVKDSIKDVWIDKMIQLLSDLNINGNVQSELNKIKCEDLIQIKCKDNGENQTLKTIVSDMGFKLAELTGEMASLQNVQTQQSEETTKHAEKVNKSLQELKERNVNMKTFLNNNPDIDGEINKDIQEQLSQIKVLFEKQFKGVNNKQPIDQKVRFQVQVLQQCLPELVQDLNVNLVLDYIGSKGIIHPVTLCDIKEQATTSDKIRKLIQYLMESDEPSYHKFKECLEESGQSDLKNFLEDVERKAEAKGSDNNIQKDEEAYAIFNGK